MFALVLWLAAQDKKGVLPQTENAWRAAGYVEVRPGIWHRD
jgi:hypothetical protein